jgi:primosomal protein N' (replication factor Y)
LQFARVVVDVPTRAVDRPFDYLVPEDLASAAMPGAPVLVTFSGRRVVGWVVGLSSTSDVAADRILPVTAVLDQPLLPPWAPEIAEWMAVEYVAPLSDALRLFAPPGGAPQVVREFAVVEGAAPADGSLRGRVYDAVAAGEASPSTLRRRFGAGVDDAASALVRSGALRSAWRLAAPAVGAVDDRIAELVDGVELTVRANATLQRSVLDALTDGPVAVPELTAELGSVSAALKRLVEAGAVRVTSRRRFRTPTGSRHAAPRPETLSDGQRSALAAIGRAQDSGGGVVLLHGVTGSGKTEVYLQAIERTLERGRGAIVLVPEISLTPQTVGRFRARFGAEVAVVHSRLSAGERYDQWDLVRTGAARVVVGARSALFAPVSDLGLIVIDEEHEHTYKQGSAPRYHARDVAERLAAKLGIPLVLGSATPALESIVAAEQGRFELVELPERVAGGAMPQVRVVDMAAEFADGHRSMFSRPLLEGLAGVAERGEKAVLLINRRGYASFLLCRECGFVPGCPDCDVSLTYHDVGSRLVCHHCGHTEAVPPRCPSCGSPYLRQFGTGTQRVEAELAVAAPGLPIVRMDADTTMGKGGHEKRLVEFEAMSSGVLLGTQMVAKGLDYPEVTLVGVVNADTTLHLPDFRAAERTWQLLEQVGGRAGRGKRPGLVVIQTYWPDHHAVRAAAAHDPAMLYDPEKAERASLGYPPFGRLADIGFTGEDLSAVRTAAGAAAAALTVAVAGRESWRVLGPSPAPIARVRRLHRWHVLLKAPPGASVPEVVAAVLRDTPVPAGVSVAPDIDPMDLL